MATAIAIDSDMGNSVRICSKCHTILDNGDITIVLPNYCYYCKERIEQLMDLYKTMYKINEGEVFIPCGATYYPDKWNATKYYEECPRKISIPIEAALDLYEYLHKNLDYLKNYRDIEKKQRITSIENQIKLLQQDLRKLKN